jgi:hypothetical protein
MKTTTLRLPIAIITTMAIGFLPALTSAQIDVNITGEADATAQVEEGLVTTIDSTTDVSGSVYYETNSDSDAES